MLHKKVSMDTIARHLGLSRNAVWLALAGKSGVSLETRQRVMDTAAALGYRRPTRTVTTKTTGHIGLVLSEAIFHETSFFGPIIMHLQRQVAALGANLTIQPVSDKDNASARLPALITEGRVDGIIILSSMPREIIEAIGVRIPTVVVDHDDALVDVDQVGTANRLGAYRGVHYLTSLGHRNIGFIGRGLDIPSYRARFIGYREALYDMQLPFSEAWTWKDAEQSDPALVQHLKSVDDWPSAWFCANDALAFHLVRALQALGISVPQGCSVIGFDNQMFAEMSDPPLTTLSIDRELFARIAVQQLFERIADPMRAVRSVVLNPKLLIRQSTAEVTVAVHSI